MTDHRCHPAGADQPRMLRTHLDHCDTSDCQGCQPCPERHCQVCDREHVTVDGRGTDQTCASCIGAARDDLSRIAELQVLMITAATERGVNSLAAMHAGPAADHEAWSYVHQSVTSGRLCRCRTARRQQCPATLPPATGPTCPPKRDGKHCAHDSCARIRGYLCPDVTAWLEDCRDELHPLWVLGTWDFNVRDHLGHLEHNTTITVADAAAYLDSHLTRLAHDRAFDFAQFATDLHACRTHLDEVLAIAPHVETGAPCPTCGRANLEKSYGDNEADDCWTCPRCREWWTETDYRAKVAGIYVGVATALTASQIRETYRVPEATVRKWAERGKVRRRGDDPRGRQLYDVNDVLDARDTKATA